jgi:hypothetical protein
MLRLKYRFPELAAICCGAAALVSCFAFGNWLVAMAACSIGALILVCS